MSQKFKVGDHVGWNSEVAQVSDQIIKVDMQDFKYKGHMRCASVGEPQYAIERDISWPSRRPL